MTDKTRVVFWQNTISIHQSPLVRALVEAGTDVLVVTQQGVSPERRDMGWHAVDFGGAEVITAPTSGALEALVEGIDPRAHHVFSGLDAYPMVAAARRLVHKGPHGHAFIATESWDARGIAGALRSWRYSRRSKNLRDVDTVLTIGTQARRQFGPRLPERIRVADFGYFVEAPDAAEPALTARPGDPLELLFVGSLTPLKQIDVLLHVLAGLTTRNWRLTVIGDGPLRGLVEEATTAMPENVIFLGVVTNAAVRAAMLDADVLVLPSKYDGWGAVVSEALMAGTSVLVSDEAGASDVVGDPVTGAVFDARSRSAFERAVRTVIEKGPRPPEERDLLARWASSHISPRVAAAYLLELAENPGRRVAAPWHLEGGHGDTSQREGHLS